jgi:hypothetical protein
MFTRSGTNQEHLHVNCFFLIIKFLSYFLKLFLYYLSRNQITNCLVEMMNPKFRFEILSRAERVACIK